MKRIKHKGTMQDTASKVMLTKRDHNALSNIEKNYRSNNFFSEEACTALIEFSQSCIPLLSENGKALGTQEEHEKYDLAFARAKIFFNEAMNHIIARDRACGLSK